MAIIKDYYIGDTHVMIDDSLTWEKRWGINVKGQKSVAYDTPTESDDTSMKTKERFEIICNAVAGLEFQEWCKIKNAIDKNFIKKCLK